MFLKDYWYVAAWSNEVTAEPLARMFLGENDHAPVLDQAICDVALNNRNDGECRDQDTATAGNKKGNSI